MEPTRLRSAYFKESVAVACRMIALEGYADLTLGHVSMRDAESELVYIKRRGPGLHEIEPEDVLVHSLHDDAGLKIPGMHPEAVLHTEVYKRRSDVHAVVHSHPPYATAFGATDAEFHILNHDGLLFGQGVASYDDTFHMITEPHAGAQVAQILGDRRALLLRNHGVVVVGEDIRWAVLAAISLERAIKVQMIAAQMGRLRPIPAHEAREFFDRKFGEAFLNECWAEWTSNVRNAGTQVPRQVFS